MGLSFEVQNPSGTTLQTEVRFLGAETRLADYLIVDSDNEEQVVVKI